MTQPTVLDASAVIAFLQGEPGEEVVRQALLSSLCVVSAANQAEIIAKCTDRGIDPQTIQTLLTELNYTVVDVSVADGAQAGWLRAPTRAIGLSLGDRLCMALAQRQKAKLITADRPWLALAQALSLDVHCIRPDSH
jgi:ribonuclease VapC